MEEADDLSKLEELLAAEDSDEDNVSTSLNISLPGQSTFLQEVVEVEEQSLLRLKDNNETRNKNNILEIKDRNEIKISEVHNGDTDSSDDEEKQNFLERKYSDYGLEVKTILQHKQEEKRTFDKPFGDNDKISTSFKSKPKILKQVQNLEECNNVYKDPVFGIRIVKPLISNSVLVERMQGREAISMDRVKRHVAHGDLSKDWVIAGIIVRKSATKESQKGAQYCIWTLSDLKNSMKTVAIFLFRNAHKQLWKTSQGMVVGILNPSVLDKKDDSSDEACLSIDNPDRVMIFGNSKDFGFCKSRKKNGDPCTSFVNVSQCEHCVYHVKQEYQKCSRRSELQSSTAGRGIFDLRNKVFGKNTVIYGGKAYSSVPAVQNRKQVQKDKNRLMSLSEHFQKIPQTNRFQQAVVNKSPMSVSMKKNASRVEAGTSQKIKDLERLELLRGGPSASSECLNKTSSPIVAEKKKSEICYSSNQNYEMRKDNITSITVPTLGIPILGFGLNKSSVVDLSIPITKKHSERAKNNALKWIKNNGPINKIDPNNIRGTTEGKKRNLSTLNTSSEGEIEKEAKKAKTGVGSDNFQKMLTAKSAHSDLIVQHDDSEADKYFNKLEKKEMMEEKMLNTHKVPCKAVRCLKCKYTSFSAASRCKEEKHPLKVFDTEKRFFKCSHCGNRQVCLEIIPTNSCKNCSSTSWKKAGMIAERKPLTLASKLSITGGEEFLGHVEHDANINLLVPEN